MTFPLPTLEQVAAELRELGVDSVNSYAWRDLDDPEAGGSELHADEILSRWAAAGLKIEHRTSANQRSQVLQRNGYTVHQRGGRYSVFFRVIPRRMVAPHDPSSATLEIWNGVPWFSPLWRGRQRVVWMHHVHRDMWADVLPGPLAAVGKWVETRFAPLWYKTTRIVTLSESSRREIELLGIHPSSISVIPPGVSDRFHTDESRRSSHPHVVAVGRLAPVKRFHEVLAAVETARNSIPDLTVEIVGEGAMRGDLERWIGEHDAESWARLTGRVSDDELVQAYQRAWLVVSASSAEGWGMSLTEAAACSTPAVATDIPGHRDSVLDGVTGDLVADLGDLGRAIVRLLTDAERRATYAAAAREHAASSSWDAVAARQLRVLLDICRASRH